MKRSAFTLIELLVVISIISLLSSVVLSSLSTARAKARDARRMSDLRQINTAVLMYQMDNNGNYPGLSEEHYRSRELPSWNSLATILRPYIFPLPVDPKNGQQVPGEERTYGYEYNYSCNDGSCIVRIGTDDMETTQNPKFYVSY